MSILEVRGLKKIYSTRFGGNKVEALRNVNFTVEEGEYVAVMGESGSGKTTLLNILAALDKPTNGNVVLDGKDLSKIKEKDVAAFPVTISVSYFRISTCLTHLHLRTTSIFPLFLQARTIRK